MEKIALDLTRYEALRVSIATQFLSDALHASPRRNDMSVENAFTSADHVLAGSRFVVATQEAADAR